MMISTRGRYALRVMIDLAEHNDGGYIAMKTAQGNVVPWLASQTDVLAGDWCVYLFEDEAEGVQ